MFDGTFYVDIKLTNDDLHFGYFNMRGKYVEMQLNLYQHATYFCQLKHINVNMQLIHGEMQLIYVSLRNKYIERKLIYVQNMHMDIRISHVNTTKLHINIKSCMPYLFCMST